MTAEFTLASNDRKLLYITSGLLIVNILVGTGILYVLNDIRQEVNSVQTSLNTAQTMVGDTYSLVAGGVVSKATLASKYGKMAYQSIGSYWPVSWETLGYQKQVTEVIQIESPKDND